MTQKWASDDHARLCADQGFSNFFAHVPLSIKYIISRHLIYADAIIQLHKYDNGFQFSMDEIMMEPEPKILDVGYGSGSKNIRCLEPEPQNEIWVPASQACFMLL